MLKKIILLLSVIPLFIMFVPMSAYANDEYCTVTFRSMDRYIYFGNKHTDRASYDIKVGNTVTHPNVHSTLYGCDEFEYRLKSTGETVDLDELTVTEDMTIEVYFSNPPEAVYTVTYICHEFDIRMPQSDIYNSHSEITISCADGYILSEDDLPEVIVYPGYYFHTPVLEWTPAPVGYEVHENVTFTAAVKDTGFYEVHFYGIDFSVSLAYYGDVPRGSSVEPPKDVPDWHDYMFIGWNSDDYLNVQRNLQIFAKYALRGDANMNDEIDVGDATLILRAVVKLDEPGLNYDYNKNGRVDSGDAAGVLLACVNK